MTTDNRQMTNDGDRHLQDLQKALVAMLRSRINQMISSLGLSLASGTATLTTIALVAFLGINLFFFLNIALGFALGTLCGGSPAWGFLLLSLIYLLAIALYLGVVRAKAERQIRNGVARTTARMGDQINAQLDANPQLLVDEAYRELRISAETYPYQALELRREEASKRSEQATTVLRGEISYLKDNYKAVAMAMAHERITLRYPAYRYIAPVVGLFASKQDKVAKPKQTATPPPRSERARPTAPPSLLVKATQALKPVMPYLGFAYDILKPVAMSFVVGRTQGWLLKRLGLGKLKSRRKR